MHGHGGFDPHTPASARIYDFLLGGKDNFAADRSVGEKLTAIFPEVAELAAQNRQFLARASAWAAHQGVRQFLDLGCGMPSEPNVHEVVQGVDRAAQVTYVDNDRGVVTHLRALSEHGNAGVSVLDADVRDVPGVLKSVSDSLDLSRPACVIMGCLLQYFTAERARSLVTGYTEALVPGSYLVVSVGCGDSQRAEEFYHTYSGWASQAYNHPADDVATFFGSLPLVPPGLVDASQWRPDVPPPAPLPDRGGQILVGVASVTG